MLKKAIHSITKISDNDEINFNNYLDSLNYVSILYKFLNLLKLSVSDKSIVFLPSFKGKYIVETLRMSSTSKENEMKVIKIKSDLFLVDETLKDIKERMDELCEDIVRIDDVIIFTLK